MLKIPTLAMHARMPPRTLGHEWRALVGPPVLDELALDSGLEDAPAVHVEAGHGPVGVDVLLVPGWLVQSKVDVYVVKFAHDALLLQGPPDAVRVGAQAVREEGDGALLLAV